MDPGYFRLRSKTTLQTLQQQSQQGKQPPQPFLIILRNFQFFPSSIQVKMNSKIIVKVEENRREYSGLYDKRGFILAVEDLEIESPQLGCGDSWSFQIKEEGRWEMKCINYCKLGFVVNVVQEHDINLGEEDKRGEAEQMEKIIDFKKYQRNQEEQVEVKQKYQPFTYQQFQNIISDQTTKFSQIPSYLLRCFKTQLDILHKFNKSQTTIQQPPKVSSSNYREHSTNTEDFSAYQSFDDNRRVVDNDGNTSNKNKALTIFEDEERGELEGKGLKKTSSQLLNLDWKQEMSRKEKSKEKEKSRTFEEECTKFAGHKDSNFSLPSNSHAINNLLAFLKNRISIIQFIS